ncbi:hypothetical protein BKA65DRAFT_453389, partial [Rhexocercosporidium sp. MPI-PUGE-AT-0058]
QYLNSRDPHEFDSHPFQLSSPPPTPVNYYLLHGYSIILATNTSIGLVASFDSCSLQFCQHTSTPGSPALRLCESSSRRDSLT